MKPKDDGLVECALVDGPVTRSEAKTGLVASYMSISMSDAYAQGVPGACTHSFTCMKVMTAVEPAVRIHVIRVFRYDGEPAPAVRVLEGLLYSVNMGVRIICLPSTIDRTRHEGRFREVCTAADKSGIIVVAAWARGAENAVPASYAGVVGVASHRPGGGCRFLTGLRRRRAVATPMRCSGGVALIAGLAAVYLRQPGISNRSSFVKSISGFMRAKSADLRPTGRLYSLCREGGDVGGRLGRTYRNYLADVRSRGADKG